MIKIAKIPNDKYYTSPELAEYCVNKTNKIIVVGNLLKETISNSSFGCKSDAESLQDDILDIMTEDYKEN